jgi:hypothetical protein
MDENFQYEECLVSRRKNIRKLIRITSGLAIGVAVSTISPPIGIAVGVATLLKSARDFAQTSDLDAGREMITGYSDFQPNSKHRR